MKLSVYTWIIIIFFVIIMIVILWVSLKKKGIQYKDQCSSNSDCSNGNICVFSKDLNRKICVSKGQKECVLTPSENLQLCDPNDPTSCNTCINLPDWSCVPVSSGKVKIQKAGTNYSDGTVTTTNTTGKGTGMLVSIKTLNGVIQDPVIISNSGDNYQKDDIIQLASSGDKNAELIITEKPSTYYWKQGDTTINVPESPEKKGWCLPNVKPPSGYCNDFTSDTVLIEYEPKKYKWGCHCKIQNLFDQLYPTENCIIEKACGAKNKDGALYVIKHADGDNKFKCNTTEDCNKFGLDNSKCCAPDTGSGQCDDTINVQKYCHVPWLSQLDSDPIDGRCECKPGLTYFGYSSGSGSYNKVCVKDSCEPNGKKTELKTCACNPGYIQCPEDVTNYTFKNICQNSPQCIPDPCLPFGEFDKKTKTCKCDKSPTTGSILDISSPIGMKCIDYCEKNGPCGNRGTCTTGDTKDPNKVATCTQCICPYCNPGDPGCPTDTDPNKPTPSVCIKLQQSKGGPDWPCTKDVECCSGYCDNRFFIGSYTCR